MTIAPPTRESPQEVATGGPEVLIKEARRRGRRHRFTVVLLVLGVIAAIAVASLAFGLSGSPAKTPTHPKATVPPPVVITNAPRCTTSELVVGFEGMLAGAGSWNELFGVRNTSSRACSIAGFPSVRLLSSTGGIVPIPINYAKGGCTRLRLRDGRTDLNCGVGGLKYHGAFPRAILAAHTGVASFFIEGRDNSTWGPGQTHPTVCRTAPRIRVALSRSPRWHNVTGMAPSHEVFACGAVAVLPLVPGRSGYFPAVPLSYTLGVSQPLTTTSTTVVGTQPPLTTSTTIP